jgi:hypothetical protein
MKANFKGSVLPMLESIKNSFIGKVHLPHTHFIDYGIHSISLKLYLDSKELTKKESVA